jgi:copper(I)-binding protein
VTATAAGPPAPTRPAPTRPAPTRAELVRNLHRDLARGAIGPVICAVLLVALLSAWVAAGGAGTLSRVRIQVSLAAVPMRGFTPQGDAAIKTATTFLTIRNISSTPDELIAARSPIARRVVLTTRAGSGRTAVASLAIPAHGTLTLSPFGADLVLQDPAPYESQGTVPLILTFRGAGPVTVEATVTAPGTP